MMPDEQQSHASLRDETAALREHSHALMVRAYRDLMRRILDSHDLIAQSRAAIAEADRLLGGGGNTTMPERASVVHLRLLRNVSIHRPLPSVILLQPGPEWHGQS
jgi:hypothetical protein